MHLLSAELAVKGHFRFERQYEHIDDVARPSVQLKLVARRNTASRFLTFTVPGGADMNSRYCTIAHDMMRRAIQ